MKVFDMLPMEERCSWGFGNARARSRVFGLFLFFFLFFFSASAQFYTGSSQTFGRKRVQYNQFYWYYYRFDGFDVYFNSQGRNLALYTANYVQNHLDEMENLIGYQSQVGLRFIVFNRLSDFKQSNIGYLDENSESNGNPGGITRFLDNKVFLYFEGNYLDFERQIRRGIAEILLSQAITGTKVGAQYRSSYLMDLPRWFTGGLALYFSRPWDEELDERLAASIRKRGYKYFSALEGEEGSFAGHSFWNFIAEKYGPDAVARCVRVVASERRINKTFEIAVGVKYKDLVKQWRNYYWERYGMETERDTVLATHILKRTNRVDHVYDRFVLNPGGEEAAFVSNKLGRAKVYLQTLNPARRFCIYRTGAAINDNPDYSFPLLCFHPDGERLGVICEDEGHTVLYLYDIEKNRRGRAKRGRINRHTRSYPLDAFDKVSSFSFSPNGRSVALAATSNGYPDIYLFRLGTGTRERITFDLYDDDDPVFVPGTNYLIFTSNRPDDTIRKNERFLVAPSMKPGRNLYAYDLEKGGKALFAMTEEDARTLLRSPRVLEDGRLLFTSNKYGQTNMALGQMGRTISHIDTAIHYRSTFESGVITDLDPGMVSFDASAQRGEYAQIRQQVTDKGRYWMGIDLLERVVPSVGTGELVLREASGLSKEEDLSRALIENHAVQGKDRKVRPSRFKKELWDREKKRLAREAYQDSLARAIASDTSLVARELAERRLAQTMPQLRNAEAKDFRHLTEYDIWLLKRAGLWHEENLVSGDSELFSQGLVPDGSLEKAVGGQDSSSAHVSLKSMSAPLSQAWHNYRMMWSRSDSADVVAMSDSAARAWFMQSLEGGDSLAEENPLLPPRQNTYQVEYFINSATTQLSFDYLSSFYQQFTNSQSPIYLNPGTSGLTQISMSDLMENHRIIGGFGFSLDFSSTEYLFSYEYLERRLGHQIILHMVNLNASDDMGYPYKQNTYDAHYVMKYPLTPVSMIRGTVFGRYDRSIQQAIDYPSLMTETYHELRVGLKAEWVYDHSRFITQNIYFGTRGKVWAEYYQGVLNNLQNLFVVGVDFRDYRRLYKTMIWANRIAFSTSFGQQKLVYYMGGVDSWIGARFNQDVQTDPNQNYAYQTLATNMRGFTQNIRNGNTFAVINSEIRIPFVQVISPQPVQSSFLRHLQLVLFGDVGSAWSGWNPWSKDNLFYKQTIEDGKLTVVLDKNANPFVAGFGVGLRMQLFGYFLRGDVAWGAENGIVHKKPVFYFSLSTDF